MITLNQIYKSYNTHDVLNNINLHINSGERIGLVGPNGSGKSTILGLMRGTIEPDKGKIFKTKNLRLGYLPQELLTLSKQTVLELAMDTGDQLKEIEAGLWEVHQSLEKHPEPTQINKLLTRQEKLQTKLEVLEIYSLKSRAIKILSGLGFTQEQLNLDISILSGGWLMRAALARILIANPDLILLDEPSNHLDIDSLHWLENYLTLIPTALVIASHDRMFLDKIANQIVEIENGQLYSYGGNYSFYLKQRQIRREAQRAAYENQQNRIHEIKNFIVRNRSRKDRAKQVQSRLKMLKKTKQLSLPSEDEIIYFKLPKVEQPGNLVTELVDVDYAYGQNIIYQSLNFNIRHGDKLALLGKNGAGKSTLLKLLSGQIHPQRGHLLVGSRTKIGFFNQYALQNLNPNNNLLTELSDVGSLAPISYLRSLLGCFLFKEDEVFKEIKNLSGGEKSRLILAKLLLSSPNVLFLDEPTNHLDIQSQLVLEKALKKYQGTIVLISHNRHFINAICNKIAYIKNGKIIIFPGNYDEFYRVWKNLTTQEQKNQNMLPYKSIYDSYFNLEAIGHTTSPPNKKLAMPKREREQEYTSGPKTITQKRIEAETRNALYQKLMPMKHELNEIEKQITQTQNDLDALGNKLTKLTSCFDPKYWRELSQSYDTTKKQLDKLIIYWEELAIKIEKMENIQLSSCF